MSLVEDDPPAMETRETFRDTRLDHTNRDGEREREGKKPGGGGEVRVSNRPEVKWK